MVYADYLRELLAPLRLYDLLSGAGAAELEGAGEQLDELFDALEEAEREGNLHTALGEGLACYEALLPYTPAYSDTDSRRAALEALLRIDGRSFTCEALNNTIAGCGIAAAVEESDTPRTVRVSFPGLRGIPARDEEVRERIEQILPCHLGVEYVYRWLLWSELEENLGSWRILERRLRSWAALEVFDP